MNMQRAYWKASFKSKSDTIGVDSQWTERSILLRIERRFIGLYCIVYQRIAHSHIARACQQADTSAKQCTYKSLDRPNKVLGNAVEAHIRLQRQVGRPIESSQETRRARRRLAAHELIHWLRQPPVFTSLWRGGRRCPASAGATAESDIRHERPKWRPTYMSATETLTLRYRMVTFWFMLGLPSHLLTTARPGQARPVLRPLQTYSWSVSDATLQTGYALHATHFTRDSAQLPAYVLLWHYSAMDVKPLKVIEYSTEFHLESARSNIARHAAVNICTRLLVDTWCCDTNNLQAVRCPITVPLYWSVKYHISSC